MDDKSKWLRFTSYGKSFYIRADAITAFHPHMEDENRILLYLVGADDAFVVYGTIEEMNQKMIDAGEM